MRRFFLSLSFLLLSFAASYAQNISPDISGLSLEECLMLSLNNHPSLRKTKASAKEIEAQIETLRASNRVKITLTGSARYNGDYDYLSDNYHNESLALSATKLLYDNNRNKIQRQIRTENLKASYETHKNTMITVTANAKRKYYDLVLEFLDRDLQQEKVNNLEEHLKNAQGLYDVGNSPYIDVTKAQADLSSARVALLKANNDILLAQEALKVAMGTEIQSPFSISIPAVLLLPQLPENFDSLVDTALADRPDMRKILHDITAGELTIKDAARAISPTVTGQANTSLSSRQSGTTDTNYYIGVSVNVPVVDGGETKAGIARARAQLESTNADADTLRQNITYSVMSSALSLMNAKDRARAAEETVKHSEENLELAQGRYNVGVGNSIEVSDAVSALAEAKHTYYQAIYDAQTARANLDEALGHFPPEIEGRQDLWQAQ
ncbi:MAG: TolC family protein [Synergistaceae bacterium]|nr:TolC family protein [Synergistaceae bacterium]